MPRPATTTGATLLAGALLLLGACAAPGGGPDGGHASPPPSSSRPAVPATRATATTTRRPVHGGALGPDVGPAAATPARAPRGKALEAARSELAEDTMYPAFSNPEIDTLHHSLDLTYLDSVLSGRDTVTFRATGATSTVRLDLRGTLEVTHAELDGEEVATSRDIDGVVFATGPLEAGSQHELLVEYRGTPTSVVAPSARRDSADGLGWSETGGVIATMSEPYGALTWYPCNDWTADKALYDVRITTAGDVIGVTNGALTGRTRTADRTVTTWHLAQPTAPYLTTLAIGDLTWTGVPLPDGRTFNLWHRAAVPAETAHGWATQAVDAYTWLTARLTPYPFDEIGTVAVPQASAMETATLITMGEEAFPSQGRSVLLHEMSHQWFGDSVTPKDWKAMWLNEGWAMYIQLAYLRDTGAFTAFGPPAEACRATVGREGQAGDYDPNHFAGTNVYMCGAALLDEIHDELGEEEFWAMARAWADAHAGGNVDRTDFASFLRQRYHKDFSPVLRTWLDDVKPLG